MNDPLGSQVEGRCCDDRSDLTAAERPAILLKFWPCRTVNRTAHPASVYQALMSGVDYGIDRLFFDFPDNLDQ